MRLGRRTGCVAAKCFVSLCLQEVVGEGGGNWRGEGRGNHFSFFFFSVSSTRALAFAD